MVVGPWQTGADPLKSSRWWRMLKTLARGCLPLEGTMNEAGFCFQTTVLRNVPLYAAVRDDKPFISIALLRSYSAVEGANEQSNRLAHRIAAFCFSQNGGRQNFLGDAVEAGMVIINNTCTSWPDPTFGGIKENGFASEDGPEGVDTHMMVRANHAN